MASVLRCALTMIAASVPASLPGLPTFRGAYGSSIAEHERFGREMGAAFAPAALKRLGRARNAALVEWATRAADGMRTLSLFAEAHERAYPLFMAELSGLAEGVGVPFAHILALNLHQVRGREGARHAARAAAPRALTDQRARSCPHPPASPRPGARALRAGQPHGGYPRCVRCVPLL